MSFEIDHLDEVLSEGWSVMVSGEASRVTDPAAVMQVRSLEIAPWAGDDRDAYIRITAHDVSGRRIRITR